MIKNQVYYVKEEEYISKMKKKEDFIKKIEIGKKEEDNIQLIKRIFYEVGSEWYQDITDRCSNYNAIKDYLSDISYALEKKYQALEIYIYNVELIDENFIKLLKKTIKEHEFEVANYSGGNQRMISFDIYVKLEGEV